MEGLINEQHHPEEGTTEQNEINGLDMRSEYDEIDYKICGELGKTNR